jgi:hypothetical protein
MFEEIVNSLLKGRPERQSTKIKIVVSSGSVSKFLYVKDSFKKEDEDFFENLGLLIVKNNLQIQFVETMWLKHLVLCLCPKLNFPSKRQFSQEILLRLVEKTNQQYGFPTLVDYFSTKTDFDLWMSMRAYDVFALAINFLNNDW